MSIFLLKNLFKCHGRVQVSIWKGMTTMATFQFLLQIKASATVSPSSQHSNCRVDTLCIRAPPHCSDTQWMYSFIFKETRSSVSTHDLTCLCWSRAHSDRADIISSSHPAGPSGGLQKDDLRVSNFRHLMRFLIGDLLRTVSCHSSWEHSRGSQTITRAAHTWILHKNPSVQYLPSPTDRHTDTPTSETTTAALRARTKSLCIPRRKRSDGVHRYLWKFSAI